ncbi:MAG: putative HTH-type transcriptional regulator [Stenotrophomonas maltophilia]|nr:MAG: putative HTH-type transcriptional regulator [Stenotrophomonas maltophilia]
MNDDSIDTWFVAALADLHARHGYLFDIRMDDQDHTLALLRDGSVLGAVTADSRALKGCNVHPLGAMRYHAIAAPDFGARHFAQGMDAAALARAPMIVFNRKDALQWRPRCITCPLPPASWKRPRGGSAGAWPRKHW